MLRIRKVADDTTAANRDAIAAAQEIMRAQFPGMSKAEIDKLPEQLRDPLKHRFVSRLFVAEDGRERTRGIALLLYAPDLAFCYLELISAAPGVTGQGIGAALYERVREEASALKAHGLYFESLPDDPALSPDPKVRQQNERRLAFYERYGARPIVNTKYETPIEAAHTNPPYLVLDPLASKAMPSRETLRQVVRAILERKYKEIVSAEYLEMVVASITDDPIKLRGPKHTRATATKKGVGAAETADKIVLVVNEAHAIHHVHDRGYVEAPVRISSILSELDASNLFERVQPAHYPDRHIRAVHDGRLVDYIRRASLLVGTKRSLYPYVFPVRNPARPPRDQTVLAGYYCIDTFTPLNETAYKAARAAVDVTLTAADEILEGETLAYALVRPPGHHAESRVFGGFCYFNNAAIAANHMSRYGRIAILDIDYHHGNGQQDIFYRRADVLTVSIHGDPSFAYPYFTGFRDESGIGSGAGYNFNIPLPERITPDQHREALGQALQRIRRFAPTYLVVAAGFDTARGDPTGSWSNRAKDFERLGQMIGEEGYPTLVVQEGGYRVRTLGTNVRSFFVGLHAGQARREAYRVLVSAGRDPQRPVPRTGLEWRSAVTVDDVERVRSLVASTGFFNPAEVDIAAELVSERLARGQKSGYSFVLAERRGNLAGYACFGPIDGTDGSFDLYWIAVAPDEQRKGLGRRLMARAEDTMKKTGARRIYVDTSSSDKYEATRAFYRRTGYAQTAVLPGFYREGDGKIIFIKELASLQRND